MAVLSTYPLLIRTPALCQVRVGTGSGSALQVKVAVSPSRTIVCVGGSVMPGGEGSPNVPYVVLEGSRTSF